MARIAIRYSQLDRDLDPFVRREAAHRLRSEYLVWAAKRIVEATVERWGRRVKGAPVIDS